MQAQLACMLLLCFTWGALCTDVEQRSLAEELLSSILTSKMKQTKQSAPYWHVSLTNLCRLVGGLRQGAWSSEEEEQEAELREGSFQLLEEFYSLQHICRKLQSREERLLQDSAEFSEESSDAPLKRKSPYILKRQARPSKSRRPYILKRTSVY